MNNIKKAVDAAEIQLSAIAYLSESGMLESLPTELAETARLRMAHPDLSLAQLVAMTVPRISKPGLSHRLRRIVSIADELRAKDGRSSKKGEGEGA
jgi:DNA-binding protein WhiA